MRGVIIIVLFVSAYCGAVFVAVDYTMTARHRAESFELDCRRLGGRVEDFGSAGKHCFKADQIVLTFGGEAPGAHGQVGSEAGGGQPPQE